MADLKESGGLEQDGDYIFMLYRPYAQDKSKGYSPEETTLLLEKNKFSEVGRISLKFDGKYQTFTEAQPSNQIY
jgi:replicative DNA helicase